MPCGVLRKLAARSSLLGKHFGAPGCANDHQLGAIFRKVIGTYPAAGRRFLMFQLVQRADETGLEVAHVRFIA